LEYIDALKLDAEAWKKIKSNDSRSYGIISLCGIFRVSFFRKLLLEDCRALPFSFTRVIYRIISFIGRAGLKINGDRCFTVINKFIFQNRLLRFPAETPFNLEREFDRADVLPINLALSRQEMFACIDDDLGFEGYQLIKRGLYPLKPKNYAQ